MSTCDRSTIVLLSLDIAAAFDTIDHTILLDRTSRDFGVHGSVLSWLRSFGIDRHQYVAVGAQTSLLVNCTSGVPHGSVLGPLLFAMYVSPMSNVVTARSLRNHQYADDTQHARPLELVLMRISSQFQCTLKTSLAGSWKTGCFSTRPKRKQFHSKLEFNATRFQQQAVLMLLGQ